MGCGFGKRFKYSTDNNRKQVSPIMGLLSIIPALFVLMFIGLFLWNMSH